MNSVVLDFVRFPSPHDGENVHFILLELLDAWNIKGKLYAITTDNGSGMCRGIGPLSEDLRRPCFHLRCISPVINLSVKAAFGKINGTISSLRNLVAATRVSVNRRERFYELRNTLNLSYVLLPRLNVETRC